MRATPDIGPYFQILDAPSPGDFKVTIKLGVRYQTFHQNVDLKFSTMIAQYYGIVMDGLIVAEHVFRGLKRPLLHDEDVNADRSVLVYAWRPTYDYEWTGYRVGGKLTALTPPPNRVFVVLVREIPRDAHDVCGTVERWNWVREDPGLLHAPIDYQVRYKDKVWSRRL